MTHDVQLLVHSFVQNVHNLQWEIPFMIGVFHSLESPRGWGGGGGVAPYNGLYQEASPEMGTFFMLEVYKKVGISRVDA